MNSNHNVHIIACSILKLEILKILKDDNLNATTEFIDSSCHMYPEKLCKILERKTSSYLKANKKILLIFGDCHAKMIDMELLNGVARTKGINCCQILLTKEQYVKMFKEGAFFLMPEWVLRWHEIFGAALGNNRDIAEGIMKSDMRTHFIYLDTGLRELPENTLKEISDYFKMEYKIFKVSLCHLEQKIKAEIAMLNNEKIT